MSLFKKPAWAQGQLSDDDEDDTSNTNLFSHSNSYGDIVAEQEKRKREKAERQKAKAEGRTSGKREVKDEPKDQSTPKRRRITSEESEKLLKSVGITARLEQDDAEEPFVDGTPVRRSPRKQRQDKGEVAKAGRPPRRADLIDLGSSSDEAGDENLQTTPGASRTKPAEAVEEVADDSDDEFAELAQRARQQRLQNQHRSSHTPNPGGPSPSPGLGLLTNTNHDRPPDPTIQLLITSPLPGTNPLIVHRKLSQPTAAIRHAWCQKQGFSKEYAEGVFFIHRMRRVYDVTTCRSLGLEADEFGHVTMRGAEGKEGVEKVHLEAVTEELFREMKENKEKEAQARSGDVPAENENGYDPVQEESLIRLVLKAKGQADFRLKVKSSTPISRIASAYAKSVLKDASRQLRLEFDGEDLNPDEEVHDTEIEDLNVIDVHML